MLIVRVCAAMCECEDECSAVSVQGCSCANACFCVYVSISVSIFPVSGLISVTQKERKWHLLFLISKIVTCIMYVGISNEVLQGSHIALPILFHTKFVNQKH